MNTTINETETTTPKKKTTADPLAATTAAVEAAKRHHDELVEVVGKDRERMLATEAAAVEDPSDRAIKAAIDARATHEIRERALASRAAQLDAANVALEHQRREIKHAAMRAERPLAYAADYLAAAEPHLVAMDAALRRFVEAHDALTALAAEADAACELAAEDIRANGYPAGSGGTSFAVSRPDYTQGIVRERIGENLARIRDFFGWLGGV